LSRDIAYPATGLLVTMNLMAVKADEMDAA
jgi:hypothetical protein